MTRRLGAVTGALLALALAQPGRCQAGDMAQHFWRILWVPQAQLADPAFLAQVREAGFTAVQMPPGVDPAPALAAGLGFYVDQPAGKGLLEPRAETLAPLREAYQRDRDPAVMVRPACLSDEAVVSAAVQRVAERTGQLAPCSPLFVALADEASVTGHGNPLDLCWSRPCLDAFRVALQRRYPDLPALNLAWGTTFPSWQEVVPLTTDQVRRRELGDATLPRNLRPWSDHRDFMDDRFATALERLAESARLRLPAVPIGLTGMQPPGAFGGHDYHRLAPLLRLAEAYDLGGAPVLLRSLAPQALCVATLHPPAPGSPAQLPLAQLAGWLAHGTAGVVVWNASTTFDETGRLTAFGQQVRDAFAALSPVALACAGARVEPSPVWLVESQPSVRAWWMIDSAADGMTWIRRLSSYEAAHSTSQLARASWIQLLQDLGYQPSFVSDVGLPERLLRESPRCLVLPATIALSDRACQAIGAWVRAGGTLLCDHTPALYDEHLVLRRAGGLDDLFALRRRDLRWESLLVRQGKVIPLARLRSGAHAAEAGLRGDLAEPQGDFQVFLEQNHGRGRAVYLNLAVCDYQRVRLDSDAVSQALDLRNRVRQLLLSARLVPPFEVRGEGLPTCLERLALRTTDGRRILVVRLNALQRPALLQGLARRNPIAVTVDLPQPMRLRILGTDEVLGPADHFELPLDVWRGLFLEQVGAR